MEKEFNLLKKINGNSSPRLRRESSCQLEINKNDFSQRDIEILKFLGEVKFATILQIKDLFFLSYDTARMRLKKLSIKELLSSYPMPTGMSGNSSLIYYPGREGIRQLAKLEGARPVDIKKRYSMFYSNNYYFTHAGIITDLYVKIKRITEKENSDIWIESYISDRLFYYYISLKDERKIKRSIYPDSYLDLRHKLGGELVGKSDYFIEVDLGTATSKAFKSKIRRYIEFYKSGEWENIEYPIMTYFPSVLIFTTSETRLLNLKRIVENLLQDKDHILINFKLTTIDEALKDFFGPHWRSLVREEKCDLIYEQPTR